MKHPLTLALIQQSATDDIESNLRKGEESFIMAAEQGARLVAFAELAFTPFYPQDPNPENPASLAETIPGPTTERFSRLAKRFGVTAVLNMFEKKDGQTYDSSPVIDADGSILGVTRMVHIIDAPCFHETGYYAPGPGEPLVFSTRAGRIGVAICYDRHFPEYMRTLGLMGADLVVVPQAGAVEEWPPGLYEAEMQVAGFQNGYFTALCNRVGKEERLEFEGKSFVTGPDGRILAQAAAGRDDMLVVTVDLDQSSQSHARRYFLKDRRPGIYDHWTKTISK
jgi:N-carbamoylputrescine amidase